MPIFYRQAKAWGLLRPEFHRPVIGSLGSLFRRWAFYQSRTFASHREIGLASTVADLFESIGRIDVDGAKSAITSIAKEFRFDQAELRLHAINLSWAS